MKRLIALPFLLTALLMSVQSALGQPSILPPYTFDGSRDFIFTEGSWIGESTRDPFFRDFPLQTSRIHCYKARRVCLEARAVWGGVMMYSKLLEYNIREWDQEKVLADLEGTAATIELRFDLKKKVVLLTHTEKAEFPNPRKLPDYAHLDDGMKAVEKAKEK